jgi:integrase
MPLTDVAVRNAKPRERPYKLADSGGLYLYVAPTGGRLWRMDYRHENKRQTLSIGRYPITGLYDARAKRDEAKRQLATGINPGHARKEQKEKARASEADTFEVIAREWYALQKSTWVPRHAEDVIHSLERDVFPDIGHVPIREITAPQVLKLLRSIEGRPAIETARRVRQRISAVFVYAIASGRGETDPAAIVQKAMAPQKKGRQPAITDLEDAREMLRRAEATPANPVTKLALRLLALTAVRPGTLITTPWSEFVDIDAQEPMWTVPAERMKMRLHFKSDEARDHLVPLSRQALAAIEVLREVTGGGPMVFPNGRHAHNPAKIVKRIRAHGANVYLDGNKLRIVNRAKLPDAAMTHIRRHARAIAHWLDYEAAYEERARRPSSTTATILRPRGHSGPCKRRPGYTPVPWRSRWRPCLRPS